MTKTVIADQMKSGQLVSDIHVENTETT